MNKYYTRDSIRPRLIFILFLLAICSFLTAQQYQVDFNVVAGGSANMSGTLSTGESTIQGNVSIIVNQAITSPETMSGAIHRVDLGFWSRMLRTPGTPIVTATYNVFPDKVRVAWRYDPNDPPGTGRHFIFRDYTTNQNPITELLVGAKTFMDVDLPAGQQYEYRVQGANRIQSANTFQPIGDAGIAFGKTSSNGAISGFIETTLGSPIPIAKVYVTNEAGTGPAWGNSVDLNGVDDAITIPAQPCYELLDQTLSGGITTELWFKPVSDGTQTLISKGSGWELGMATSGLNYLYFSQDGVEILTTDHVVGTDNAQAIDVGGWNHVGLVRSGETLKIYINGWLANINGGNSSVTLAQQAWNSEPLILGNGPDNLHFNGLVDEFRVWDEARDLMFNEPYSDMDGSGGYDPGEFFSDINGDGQWGQSDSTQMRRDFDRLYDHVAEGEVVEPSLVACFHMNIGSGATLINGSDPEHNASFVGSWSSNQASIFPTAFTDAQGAYGVKNLNFGEGRTFRVLPSKAYHEFSPPYRLVSLNQFNPTNNAMDFQVINMISISGYARYDISGTSGALCGENNVQIWIDGEYRGTRTNQDGYYLLEVEPGRTVTIQPHKPGREVYDFMPQTKTFFNVISPQSQTFVDGKKRTIMVSVTGGACEFPLGPDEVARVSLSAINGCFETEAYVNAGGIYRFPDLAPMAYNLSVTMNMDIAGVDELMEMDTYFRNNGKSINIEASYNLLDSVWTTAEDTVNFNYHTALDFTVEGLERNVLNNYGLEQNGPDTLDIKVFERYYGGNICMLDTGSIHIKDWISDRYIDGVEDSDTLHYTFSADPADIETATLRYGLMPGLPNLTLPYTKNIEIQVADQSGYRTRVKSISAVVLGHFPRNIDFATTAPEMPLVILRRPPGDGSTASFNETSSSSTNFSLSFAGAASHAYSLKAKLGVESTIMTAPMGVGTAFNTKAQYSMEAGYKATFSLKTDNTLQITTTTSTEYTTATAVGLMGHRGTVFIGGAVNLLYGTTDVLSIVGEGATAHYAVNSEALFVPNGFATTYIYSRGYIEDLLIPELMSLVETDPDLARDIDLWEHLLAYEDSLRWATSMEDNYSLSGGGQSMTISTETTNSESITLETEIELEASVASSNGYEVAGFGISGKAKTSVALTFGSSVGGAWTNSTATSFTLMDDDFGDDFSVDVGTDDVYGTPVFNVVAGNSSCPYEEWRNEAGDVVTTPLDEPGQSWITASTMENIHPQGSAEYWIRLSNLADFPEPRTYYLSYVSASNYNGAIIRINGEDADESAPIPIELEYLGSDSAYITVTRPEGSDIYEFDDLVLKFAPECETNYAGVTEGYRVSFDAHFARPCTDAEIYQPGENWIINTVTGDSLTIIADEYDLGQSYFDNLIVQYSAMDEDSWFAVDTLDVDTLRAYGSSYSQLFWDVGSLPDGVYDVRLQSVCLDGLLNNKMAGVRGVIDRQIPEVLGSPEPIDGVLNFNDEIALNFTESINPETIHAVNVTLRDESTETEITDFQISVSEARVVLIPGILNRYIENHTLVARVAGHQDMHGNPGEPIEWEFVVDRNPVAWSTSELSHIAFQGQEQPIFIQLNNTGSSPESFQFSSSPSQVITPLPEWLTIFPLQGSLNPGGSFEIRLEVDQDLNNGEYDITVYAVTSEGYEPLRLDIVSMCPYPDWSFDFTEYEYSMNVTASLYSMSTASEDIYDRIAAFVDDECRGWAPLEYVPAFGNYQAFITIFSNQFSGEEVEFHLWDRTACAEYWQVDTSLVFVDGAFHGSPEQTIALNASGVLGQTLALNTGFTWISLNLEASDMTVSNILKDVQATAGDRVIGHTAFAMYSDTSGWVGTLSSLDHYSMIQLDLATGTELVHVGYPIQADTVHLEISSGWNWISYLPEENMNVNHALASLTTSASDLIKNQTQFAQYVAGIGWLGSLHRMFPGMGYKLESLESGVLTYPISETVSLSRRAVDDVLPDAPWVLEDEYQFQNSMSITALLESDTIGVNNPADAIAAMVGDEVRGIARPIYIPELDAYRVFLLAHGEPGEEINLKIWDADSDIIYGATQSLGFHTDAIHGSPLQPMMLFRAPLGIGDKGYIPEVYSLSQNFPNPFNPTTKIGFGLPEDAEVSIQIYNLRGQLVVTLMEGPLTAGYRFMKWSGLDERQHQVPSGVYLVVMNTDSFRDVKKMVLLK